MPNIFTISHPNKLIEEKINFFIDWFHYTVDNIGSCQEFELENPLSLLDKVLYQIDHGKADNRATYITNYLTHSYFNKDEYLTSFDTYQELKPLLLQYLGLSAKQKEKFVHKPDLKVKLLATQKQLHKDMFKSSLNVIVGNCTCDHPLEGHKKEIQFHTQILVSEYLFCDRSRRELKQVFRKVMSTKIEEFPFSASIKTKRQKLLHISKANIGLHFEGLLNLLHTPPIAEYFVFKVYGTEFEPEVCFKYDKVTFYSKDHKKFDFIKAELVKRRHEDPISNDKQSFILASVPVYGFSPDNSSVAAVRGRKLLETELRYISWKLNKNLLVDSTENYLIINKKNQKVFGWYFSSEGYFKKFGKEIIAELNDTPFHHLGKVISPAKDHLLEYEYLYINAMKYRSIPDLWHYLETLLEVKKGDVKHIQDWVSSIILHNEVVMLRNRIFGTLINTIHPFSIDLKMLGLTFDDFKPILKSAKQKKISKLMKGIRYPFIQELFARDRKTLSLSEYAEIKKHYQSILLEAYEQRNFYVHQAHVNKKALIKLENSIFYLVRRFRWVLFSEIKGSPGLTFPELIEKVSTKPIRN
jgi:hypothetical protein